MHFEYIKIMKLFLIFLAVSLSISANAGLKSSVSSFKTKLCKFSFDRIDPLEVYEYLFDWGWNHSKKNKAISRELEHLETDRSAPLIKPEQGDGRPFSLIKFSQEIEANESKLFPKPSIRPEDMQIAKEFGSHPFVIGGVNQTKELKNTFSITGVPLADLTAKAYPTHGTTGHPRQSDVGWIRKDQLLSQILIFDNALVVDKKQLTHQIIATPLLLAIEKVNKLNPKGADWTMEGSFQFQGKNYKFKVDTPYGRNSATKRHLHSGWSNGNTQGSFFLDSIFGNYNLSIKNPKGKTLQIDSVTPHLIYRYGFYQGGVYRTPPNEIINFFGIQ